ncbi:PR domain zinc finger protein 1-like X6 [Biomphalaria pfeifferi]|uniref:PR domain zinc finger protein 1-like X6 n=1 Tax=Biomphalaria pfeifferi TaxID=112525 RepID=A0AAD8AQK0_BIOPF|nr:PR domain zinc finger protein 1-like X6 [Biomphalaria pfeifferi]
MVMSPLPRTLYPSIVANSEAHFMWKENENVSTNRGVYVSGSSPIASTELSPSKGRLLTAENNIYDRERFEMDNGYGCLDIESVKY